MNFTIWNNVKTNVKIKFTAYNTKTGEILEHADLNWLIELVDFTNYRDGFGYTMRDWNFKAVVEA